ncbi:heterogeneous nuclear ribonucleoprotein 1 isoform X1 [Lactuca sativa]|uniref:heterogeneous nuclear ribonucleoprotein 1 isoform X1 n=1 Tax=Lactuca sativa TaxID=4236 RepID=UPI000CAADA09|nr:heterogeneous nuclear ribonucleoprotein 1 isoform X1 [Lactuca sativa]XP_023742752.1 heterogeneous nuclear ribonucleoprotein 1 isoform X1 [Lactuca sativa]
MDPGKLFIGGISWDTNEDSLREYFQTFGEVIEAVIMKDRITGRARGFGFVVFLNPVVAERVVKEKHIIDGRTVEAKKAVPRDDQQTINRSNNGSIHGSPSPSQTSSKKIFVGGLAPTVSELDFKNYFDQFGIITDVVVMYDHNTQRPRGFGFITYKSEESVDKVLLKTFHELNGKMVEVKRAVPKEISPGPIRNYGLSRVNSFVNGYNQRTDGRFSLVSGVRGGLPPFSLSNVGPNSDSGLGTNYGGNGIVNSGVGYGRVLNINPMFSVGSNRYAMGGGGTGNESLISSLNHNIWSNGSQNYRNGSIGDSFAPGIGFGSNGAIWSNLDSDQGGVGGGGNSSFIGRNPIGYRRNGGNSITPTSLYGEINGGGGGGGGGGDLFSVDPTWRPLSPELEVPGFFGYGFGNGSNRGISYMPSEVL